MNRLYIKAFAAAFSALALFSCQKKELPNLNNPPIVEIEGIPFTIEICDRQPGVDPDSSYCFFGTINADIKNGTVSFSEGSSAGSASRFSFEPDPVKLIQTEYNTIAFETDEDVNAASSTRSIDVVKKDARHYELRYVENGTSTIKFWNGSGNAEKSIVIRVEARKSVQCEGFEFRVGGKQFILKEFYAGRRFSSASWDKLAADNSYKFPDRLQYAFIPEPDFDSPEYDDYVKACRKGGYDLIDFCYDTDKGICLEFVGTIPRNATPDNKIYARCDPVNMKFQNAVWFDDGLAPFYIWNQRNYQGFRWMPKDNTGSESIYNGNSGTRYYPADLRYRKAWIWNRELDDRNTDSKSRQYLVYYFYEDGEERNFAGYLEEK